MKRPRLVGALVAGSLATAVVLWACSGTHEPRKAMAESKASPVAPLRYDVSTLVGLTAPELVARLGAPAPVPANYDDPVTLPLAQRTVLSDSSMLFRPGALPVVVTFNTETQLVIDMVVLGRNEEELMQQAGLRLNDTKYIVLSVFQPRTAGQLLGLRVVAR